jgi:hypothetical protein
MTISFVSVGPTARALNGNITPTLPSGVQTDDIFICVIASLDNVVSTMPSGWIAINAGTNNGTGFRTTSFYKIAKSSDKNPLVTHIGGSYIGASIVAYRGVDTTNPLYVVGTISTNPFSTIVTANSIITAVNTLVIFTGSISSSSTFSNYTGTSTPIERVDTGRGESEGETPIYGTGYTTTRTFVTLQQNPPSTFLTDYTVNSAGSTGNMTATATTAGVSNGLIIALKPSQTGNITAITDPSGANIYIDGILQSQQTSTTIAVVPVGSHTITFTEAGYAPYTQTINVTNGQTTNVCAILQQIATITSYGIVICTSSDISTCPITPLECPISASPSNYINFITTFNSTATISLTVNFTYTLDSTVYTQSVPVTLLTGTNAVYAFPTNVQYSPNTIISLTGISLS